MPVISIDCIDTSSVSVPKQIIEKIAIFCLNSVINNAHRVDVRIAVLGLDNLQAACQEGVQRLHQLYDSIAVRSGPNEPFRLSLFRSGNAWGNQHLLDAEIAKHKISETDFDNALAFIVENMGQFAYLSHYYPDSNLEIQPAF